MYGQDSKIEPTSGGDFMNDAGSDMQIRSFFREIRKYSPLSKEEEYTVALNVNRERSSIVRYLSGFRPFYLHLEQINRLIQMHELNPQKVFHLTRISESEEKKPDIYVWFGEQLNELNEMQARLDQEVKNQEDSSSLERINHIENSLDHLAEKSETMHFTQRFINSFVDELPVRLEDLKASYTVGNCSEFLLNFCLEQIQVARKRHYTAFTKMVYSNLRLVIKIAKKFSYSGIPFSDILQEGNLGLIKAVNRFDPEKGNRFSTYATWWIKQSITRAVVHRSRLIRIPIHLSEKMRHLQRDIEELHKELGREPTWREIRENLDDVDEKTIDMLRFQQKPYSLDPVDTGDDDVVKLEQLIPDGDSINPIQELTTERLKEELERILKTLSIREQKVIQLRFGINQKRRHTLEEVGVVLGVTRERIRQIESRAIMKLKHPSRTQLLENFM